MHAPPTEPGARLRALRRYTWWTVPGTAMFFLLYVGGRWASGAGVAIPVLVIYAVALAVAVAVIVVLLSRRLALSPDETPSGVHGPGGQSAAWLIAGFSGAAVVGGLQLSSRDYVTWSMVPAMMVVTVAAALPPSRRWMLVGAALVVGATVGGTAGLVAGDDQVLAAAAFPPGFVVSLAWVTLGPLWALGTAQMLHRTRHLAAELAVKDERLRFAADLHDIQGHHLQVIAMQSELATKLVGTDPDRAARQMDEVRQLAAEALHDTRTVVTGYRLTTLSHEIANATRVLAAADIETRMDLDPAEAGRAADRLPPECRNLLGLVMREAVTNVLRHSRARHADVAYRVDDGFAHLTIRNDGAIEPRLPTGATGEAAGTGLTTLAERLAAAGGTLAWEQHHDDFVVAAALPVEIRPGAVTPDRGRQARDLQAGVAQDTEWDVG